MASRSRLFSSNAPFGEETSIFSQQNYVIALLNIYSDDQYLRETLERIPDCVYTRAITIHECLNLLRNDELKNALLILIISKRFANFVQQKLPRVLRMRTYIYLFGDVHDDDHGVNDERYRGSFDSVQSLVDKITLDMGTGREKKEIISGGFEFVTENNAEFLWCRFFINVLHHLQNTDVAQREMVYSIRLHCGQGVRSTSFIDVFQREYCANHAINWYTCLGALYPALNRSLCHGDINEIFSLRVAIRSLHEQLRESSSVQSYNGSLVVYRGQCLHIDHINSLSQAIGKLICMNSFVSTNRSSELVMMFAGDPSDDPSRTPTFFTISIDSSKTNIIGADIEELSVHQEEAEYLFSLRSMFRVREVTLIDEIWHIDLLAVDEDDYEFQTIVNPWKASIGGQSFFLKRHQPLYSRYLNAENGSFLCFQLLMDTMLRLNRTDFAREEMIEMCQEQYADSANDQRSIDQFEKCYQYDDAIRWYTADSFLYRLLHRSIRMENIDHIFKLRYFIHDLHNQLAEQHLLYVQSLPQDQPILTLYRGERMKMTELDALRDNVGELTSMNSFLSTTNDCEAAVFFSGDGALDEPGLEVSVLYQITVDTRVAHSIPFAKIHSQSIYKDEAEVLFSMASVFRIDEVEKYGGLWVVDLTLIDKEDEEWNTLTAHLTK